MPKTTTYQQKEEKLNVLTHGFGLLLSVVGLVLLIIKISKADFAYRDLSLVVFGVSMIFLYGASTFYHNEKDMRRRRLLNILDHCAIYVLIAGAYTPFTLITLRDGNGLLIFGIVWAIAFLGIIFKLFFTGKFDILSTILYVAMGWIIIFNFDELTAKFDETGIHLLIYGGIAYTFGAVLYAIDKIPYNHAIFHVFVLLGSLLHFLAVYWYV